MLLTRKNKFCNLNNLNNNSELLLINNKNKTNQKRKSVGQTSVINYNISININDLNKKRRNSRQSNIIQPITIKTYSTTKNNKNKKYQQ